MDLSYGPEAEAFRAEVRSFLKQEWRPAGRSKRQSQPPKPSWILN